MIYITDEDAQKAANYLRDCAEEAAEARANRMYVEEYRKTVKARAMQRAADTASGMMPLQAQEREAYADVVYVDYLNVIKEAVKIDEKYRFLREAAHAKISAWQTMNKNLRSAV